MARLVLPKHGAPPQNEGERKVIDYLLSHLPPHRAGGGCFNGWEEFGQHGPEYIIIPNVEFPDDAARFLEVDAIVIAPHATYLIESKDWGPKIEGDDWGWVLNETRERPNPHKTLNYKCRVIRSIVSRQSPDVAAKVWFQSVVVIPRLDVDLQLKGKFAEVTFRLDDDLEFYLKDPHRLSTPRNVEENAVAAYQKELATLLCGEGQGRRGEKLVIAGYEVEDKLAEGEGVVEYLARSQFGKKKGPPKRLRVFRVPYVANAQDRQQQRDKILRDYTALETVGYHPNIVPFRSIQDWESEQVVEVLDWSEYGSLRRVMEQGTLTLEQKLFIVKGIAGGLHAVHEKGVIHRDLRPDNILMAPHGPQLMNFDLAFMAESSGVTVWKTIKPEGDCRYLPPELCRPSGVRTVCPASDLYSLGVIFYELLTGAIPFETPDALVAVGGTIPDDKLPSRKVPGLPTWVDSVVRQLYASDLAFRYHTAEEFLFDLVQKMQASPEPGTHKEGSVPPQTPPQRDANSPLVPGDRIGDFRIVRCLPSGGFCQVYEATHVIQETAYALKVYNDSVPIDALVSEFRFLNSLCHPHIVEVAWTGQLPNGRFYLAMELLKGESLYDYADGNKRMPFAQVLQVGADILSALRYLHEPGEGKGELDGKSLYHRDVKPSNIMRVSNRGFVLIDFNISKEASRSRTFAGTHPYLAPDLIKGTIIEWDASGDLFALGVTLYQLVTKNYPFGTPTPQVDEEPADPRTFQGCESLSEEFCLFLRKAAHPLKANRFRSAEEMQKGLAALAIGKLEAEKPAAPASFAFSLDKDEERRANYNPFVRRLRRLYSQALRNNAGTRGLDEIAVQTYVQTRLDRQLVPEILNGSFKLVIISGNAGDGKTALIQQLEKQADGVVPLPSGNGSQFNVRGASFLSNYDGSQDEGKKPNDQVLDDFLKPFAGLKDMNLAKQGRILAINEGRLVEFLSAENRKKQFGYLYETVDRYFNERSDAELPPGMIIVNLNWRSVVAKDDGEPSLFDKQLQALLKPEFWNICGKCEHRDKCVIRHNALTLGDPAAGPVIRQRLETLFEAVHLRRQLHITIRHLRSALSFLITRDIGCEDIPDLLARSDRLEYAGLAYWNITDGWARDPRDIARPDSGIHDRLVQLLRSLDVGLVAQPGIDRDIHFLTLDAAPVLETSGRPTDYPGEILRTEQSGIRELIPGTVTDDQLERVRTHHRLMVRRLYFEGRGEGAGKRLPHGNLGSFKKVLDGKPGIVADAQALLVQAISLSEGCRNRDLAIGNICIAANEEKDPRWHTFRLFPADGFEVVVPTIGALGRYLEHRPDRFVLRHRRDHKVALEVNLDMYELMSYVARGFSPSLNDLRGRYIELIIFKNTLQHLPYRSVVISEDQHQFFKIEADAQNRLVVAKV